MTAETLARAVGCSLEQAKREVDACNAAMIRGKITTRRRAVSFLREVGHESVGLRYRAEIGGRNTRYAPFYGRTYIQVTWRSNYLAFGRWLGLGDLFVRKPHLLEETKYAWLGPVWYWTSRNLNAVADTGNFDRVSYLVNGGWNGIADRRRRGAVCWSLGDAILPTPESDLRFLTKRERKWVDRFFYHRALHIKHKRDRHPVRSRRHLGWARWYKARIRARRALLWAVGRRRGWKPNHRGARHLILYRLLKGWSKKRLAKEGAKR